MNTTLSKSWRYIILFNLVLVAMVGVLMRYKIIAPLPGIEHRNLMHGHSHFAFGAWVSMSLFYLIIEEFKLKIANINRWFTWYYIAILLSFCSFLLFGYNTYSLLSIVHILLPMGFLVFGIFKSAAFIPKLPKMALSAGLIYLLVSQMGLLFLSYRMANPFGGQTTYLSALYFYLHFSYNGWFFFGILSLVLGSIKANNNLIRAVWILILTATPAYLLSLLWLKIDFAYRLIAGVAAFLQLAAFAYIIKTLWSQIVKSIAVRITKFLWLLALVAVATKFLLQTFSVFPIFETIAFAHRAIVIGYIHLVLLGFVTLFLIGDFILNGYWTISARSTRISLALIISGVLLNELVLFLQGLFALYLTGFPKTNTYLFWIAFAILIGLIALFIQQYLSRKKTIRK